MLTRAFTLIGLLLGLLPSVAVAQCPISIADLGGDGFAYELYLSDVADCANYAAQVDINGEPYFVMSCEENFGQTAVSLVWGGTNAPVVLATSGGVSLVLESADTCNYDDSGNYIEPCVQPTPSVIAAVTDPLTQDIYAGASVTLTALTANVGAAPSYQWFVDGMPIPGATDSTYTSDEFEGEVVVSVQVITDPLCGEPDTISDNTFFLVFPCEVPEAPQFITQSPTSVFAYWPEMMGASTYIILWREAGPGAFQRDNIVKAQYFIEGLTPNTNHALRLRTRCEGGGISAVSPVYNFMTPSGVGACTVPDIELVQQINAQRVRLFWDYVPGATGYRVQYREMGSPNWITRITSEANIFLNNLMVDTDYEFRVRAEGCAEGDTDYSMPYPYETFDPDDTGFGVGIGGGGGIIVVGGGKPAAEAVADSEAAPALFPNPVRDAFTLAHAEGADVAIFSSMGQAVWQGQIAEAQQRIEVAHLPAGFYVVQIRREGSAPQVLRFVKD